MSAHGTHEHFIQAVRRIAASRLDGSECEQERTRLLRTKMVYGIAYGAGYYGVHYRDSWRAGQDTTGAIEIAASKILPPDQLAMVVIHECGHALAGHAAGHGPVWKQACARLGLLDARAAVGPDGVIGVLAEGLWSQVDALGDPRLSDGSWATAGPLPGVGGPFIPPVGPRGGRGGAIDPGGRGSRGGTSRGPGSGSRLRLYTCDGTSAECRKVRVASDTWSATCGGCKGSFKLTVKG